MAYILHIDTSADSSTVALNKDGGLVASKMNMETRNHAGSINIMIEGIIAESQIALQDLDAVTVCAGPGSYTGLRIGMATAKGLCYALDKPLIADNRLTLLAYQGYKTNPGHSYYIAMLKAREKEYFIAIYDKDFQCVLEPKHAIEDEVAEAAKELSDIYIITDASEEVTSKLNVNTINDNVNIDSILWAQYTFEQFICNHFVSLWAAEPFYLKQVYTHK
jgi:tRNA threonylcarbamoyladenosine biosynthesis protein TsaB